SPRWPNCWMKSRTSAPSRPRSPANPLPVPPSPDTPARLFAQQTAFAAHLRDPDGAAAPEGIEDRRLGVYRELFFNNVEGLLAGNFPVIRELLGPERWRQLARDF